MHHAAYACYLVDGGALHIHISFYQSRCLSFPLSLFGRIIFRFHSLRFILEECFVLIKFYVCAEIKVAQHKEL